MQDKGDYLDVTGFSDELVYVLRKSCGLNFFITESGFETYFGLDPRHKKMLGSNKITHLKFRCCAI